MHLFILKHKGKVIERVQAETYAGRRPAVGRRYKAVFTFYSARRDDVYRRQTIAEIVAHEDCNVFRSDAIAC